MWNFQNNGIESTNLDITWTWTKSTYNTLSPVYSEKKVPVKQVSQKHGRGNPLFWQEPVRRPYSGNRLGSLTDTNTDQTRTSKRGSLNNVNDPGHHVTPHLYHCHMEERKKNHRLFFERSKVCVSYYKQNPQRNIHENLEFLQKKTTTKHYVKIDTNPQFKVVYEKDVMN